MSSIVRKKETSAEPRRVRPRIDVYESEHAHHVVLDVPGVVQEDVSIDLDRDVLAVAALRRFNDAESVRYERAFHVPEGVDRDKIDAQLRAGVLTVTLPKAAEAKPRRIAVAAA